MALFPSISRAPRVLLAAGLALGTVSATAVPAANAVATTHYVAASGSVGANSGCGSPGYVGANEVSIQAAIDSASSGDTVYVCAGTYAVSPRLTINKSLTFRGASEDTSILDGGDVSQILYVPDQATDITVGISRLTFRNGAANTRNGGECNLGSNCGGAIYVEDGSVINVSSSYFRSNQSMFGGAIAVINASRGSSIVDSTFEANSTLVDGGAILSLGGGGLVMDRITVVDNFIADGPESRDGSAIVVNFSSAEMTNSTLVNNHVVPDRLQNYSGQIYVNGSFVIKNSILASTGAGNIPLCKGSTPSQITSGNLLTDSSCGVSAAYPPGSTGVSTVVDFADLKLGEPGYAGYGTRTVPLLAGSAALNYWGGGSCTGDDQRGIAVPQSTRCDSGAYERHASQSLNTPTVWGYGSSNLDRANGPTYAPTPASSDPAGQGVTYSSSTAPVCTVNASTGVLTAVSNGTCTLTATGRAHLLHDKDTRTLTLTISGSPAPPTTTTVAPSTTAASATTTPQAAAGTTTTAAPVLAPVTSSTIAAAGDSSTAAGETDAPLLNAAAPTASATASPVVTTTVPSVTTTTVAAGPDAPAAGPGEASATLDGETVSASLTRQNNALVVESGDVSMTVSGVGADGGSVSLDSDGSLNLLQGDSVIVDASGYEPGSTVEVWLRSAPVQLGSRVADSEGRVAGSFVVPASVATGNHRVILSGRTASGAESIMAVGIRIGEYDTESGVNRWFIIVPIVMATILGLVIPTTTRRRRRAHG